MLKSGRRVLSGFSILFRLHTMFSENYFCRSLNAKFLFLAPLAIGQQAYVMVCCPSGVRASVRALTFSLNSFFSETTYRILMKFHRNVPAMGLFRIFFKKFDSVKNCGCHGNKTEKNLKTSKIFLSETITVRATKFGM